MKKRIAVFLLAAVMLMLAACGSKTAPTEPTQETQQTQPTEVTTQPTQATEAPTQPTQPTQATVAATQPAAPLEYTGVYWRTWNEEIGGTLAVRNAYYVLNADHTGYVIGQAVGKLTWTESQVKDELGQIYRIALTQGNGTVNLMVYEFQGNPTAYQKIAKLPAEIEAMIVETATPTPRISAPEITKNPTSETVTEGGNAYFVARANNYSTINWYIVSADRSTRMPVNNAAWSFSGLTVSGEGTTTLLLSNIPLSMNGWGVEAVFTGDGGSATTSQCFIYVNQAPKAQLYAVPSSGIYVTDQPVQLTAAPGSFINYELYDDVGNKTTGTIQSGGYVYIPAIPNCRYVARLVAYVFGNESDLTVCEYTMDGMSNQVQDYPPEALMGATEPPAPSFNGGHFYNNNDAELYLTPIGDGGFSADLGVIRVVSLEGTGSYHGGIVYLTLRDPNGNIVGGEFDVVSGTLTISTSSWADVPAGTTFYGLNYV